MYVLYEKKEEVAVITLNRPERLNALNRDLLLELRRALEVAEGDPEVKVLIITGAGRSFCVGADVAEFTKGLDEVRRFIELGSEVFSYIEKMGKPVIAAVNGYALGGGFELVLSCDFVVAASNAVFGSTEINLGIIPGWGATQKLTSIVGPAKARELVMLGELIPAEEALKLGLVHRVTPPDKLLEEAIALAKKLAEKSPTALLLAKKVLNESLRSLIAGGLELERSAFFTSVASEDGREGIKAFLEKRKPKWRS